jgi:hypothetical protein
MFVRICHQFAEQSTAKTVAGKLAERQRSRMVARICVFGERLP